MMNGVQENSDYSETNGKCDLYDDFVSLHSYQLETSDVPKHLWASLASKLEEQIYDAGSYFQMCQSVTEEEEAESVAEERSNWQVLVIHSEGIKTADSNNVFIIDHAWTYTPGEAKPGLEECKGLLERMCNLMDIKQENVDKEVLIDEVLKEMWKFNATYSINLGTGFAAEDKLHRWYVMDEFGSRIQHDGDPNFRVIPFYYHPHQCCYSILFPVKDTSSGEEVTRNYVESPPVDDLTRDAQMLPWFPVDLSQCHAEQQEEPPIQFFNSGRTSYHLPDFAVEAAPLPTDRKLKVYADLSYFKTYLTDERFEMVDNLDEADIIWTSTDFKDYSRIAETPSKRVNQFPYESLVTVKDFLAIVSRRGGRSETGSKTPPWMLPTFCLSRELVHFASEFQRREKLGLDNTWIIKPWNLARGLDQTVTNNLNHILRLPSTGPKIAQKYLHNPVLFHREDIMAKVKFDLRFIVLLLSVKPLQVAIYKNFWIRFANKSFNLNDFEDYQKHFTVNNYNDSHLLQMFCHDFIPQMESQYPCHPWSEVRDKIYAMIREVFEAATRFDAPRGIAHNPQSRGCYGIDLMVDWEQGAHPGDEARMEPKLLEVNFGPDCNRASEYYPEFFNDLFSVMFLGETRDTVQFL